MSAAASDPAAADAAIYDMMSKGQVDPKFTVIGFDDIPQGIDDLKHHRITGRLVAHIAD